MPEYEVLYIKDKKKGYPKIIAIKEVGWKWGEGEKKLPFGIAKITMKDTEKADIENFNEYCLDDFDNPKKLADTPDDHRPYIIVEEKEIVNTEVMVKDGKPEVIITKEKQIFTQVLSGRQIPFPLGDTPKEVKEIRRKVKGEKLELGIKKVKI